MSRAIAAQLGEAVECEVIERLDLPLDPVPDARATWMDAHRDICPVEIKGTIPRVGQAGNRAGRWWIQEDAHRRLLAAEGEYILAVVRPIYTRTGLDARLVLLAHLPAWMVDDRIRGWYSSGANTSASDRHTKLPWTAVFDREIDEVAARAEAVANGRAVAADRGGSP